MRLKPGERHTVRLTVNGRPVDVYPTGAWLAWLPRPEGATAHFHLTAWTDSDTARGTFTTPVAQPFSPPLEAVWIDPTAFAPAGELWVRPGEGYQLSTRASAGAVVRAILGDGDTLNFQQASPRFSRAGSQVAGATHIEELARRGAKISVLDPVVGASRIEEHSFAAVSPGADLSRFAIAAILTDHSALDLEAIAAAVPVVFDARGAYRRAGLNVSNVVAL